MKKRPTEVLKLEKILNKEGIWHNITNNHNNQVARGCWDAVNKRNRLGHSKIPIFCELKSSFGFYMKNNIRKEIMIHCRGNQEIDYKKVNKIIGEEFQRVEDENRFGLVNPFVGFDRQDIYQIFDESLVKQDFIPYTMMTNAFNRRWGIEFKVKEVIQCLPNTSVEDIVLDSTKFILPKHKIGILTGNSPESGKLLWQKINDNIRDNLGENHFLGDISFPEVIIESVPDMGLSMELDLRFEEVSKAVKQGILNLCKYGATIICIACNTTQYFSKMMEDICKKFDATYVSIPDITYKYLKENNIKEFDFMGINYVSNFNEWSGFKNLSDEFQVHLPKDKDINKISDIAFEVKKKVVTGRAISSLRRLIDKATKTNIVLLALTELSILLDSQKKIFNKSKKIYLDTLTLLAEAIGEMYTREYLLVLEKSKKIHEKTLQNHADSK